MKHFTQGFAVRTGPKAPKSIGRPPILARKIVQAKAPMTFAKGGKIKC